MRELRRGDSGCHMMGRLDAHCRTEGTALAHFHHNADASSALYATHASTLCTRVEKDRSRTDSAPLTSRASLSSLQDNIACQTSIRAAGSQCLLHGRASTGVHAPLGGHGRGGVCVHQEVECAYCVGCVIVLRNSEASEGGDAHGSSSSGKNVTLAVICRQRGASAEQRGLCKRQCNLTCRMMAAISELISFSVLAAAGGAAAALSALRA